MVCLGAYPQYTFRHIDVIDGLSDNQIRDFTEMPDGSLAIRTVSILNSYNGATFDHFYHDRKQDYKWDFDRYQIFKDYCDAEGRLWMKAPGYLTLFDWNTNRFVYDIEGQLKEMGVDKHLRNLFIDESKNYWFLTADDSFLRYDITRKALRAVRPDDLRPGEIPLEMAQYKNFHWIVYSSGIIRCWDSSSEEFVAQDDSFVGVITANTDRLVIHPTATGNVWLMHNNALLLYNRIDKTWREVATIKGPSNFFTCMDLDQEGNVWLGTSWSGLWRVDAKSYEVETMLNLKLTGGLSLNNDIQCVFVDSNDGLWIGTLWQGICYYHPSMSKFKLIQINRNEGPIANESVRCLLEDEDGSILIGTSYQGLWRYYPQSGKMEKAFTQFPANGLYLSLYRDREKRLWVGTYLNGFYCIDRSGRVRVYNKTTDDLERFPNQNISRAIYEDEDGRFWVSVSNEGVGELDLHTGRITLLRERHPELLTHKVVFNFYPVGNHTIAAFGESGIFYYQTREDKVYLPGDEDYERGKFLGPNVKYYCMFKDSRGLEWFGTELGIHIWDAKRRKSYNLNTESGLPSNSVSAFQEDKDGICWVSTINGITKIEVTEEREGYRFSLVNFDTHDGLQSGKFYDGSSLKTRNGDIYFGGHLGVNAFSPDRIRYNTSRNKPVFTSLKLFNSIIREDTEYNGHVILQQPVHSVGEIRLRYNENFLTLEFSGLNYVNPSHTYFKYRLENYDNDWNEVVTTGLGSASYTGLAPGKYRFVVYTANNDKVWGDEPAVITIVVTPPFWATGYAYALYTLLVLLAAYAIYRYLHTIYQRRAARRKFEERRKQKEELDQIKFQFFTNISHEFRTPLTLIMTPLSLIIRETKDETLRQKLASIYRNAEEILGLINQLLDFRKVEMGGEKLKLSLEEFVSFTRYVHASFKDIAANKSVNFVFDSQCAEIFICFDKEKVRKILNNLYSNALKFTPAEGCIATEIRLAEEEGHEYVVLSVTDTGCGIDESEQQSVFKRFYQSENSKSSSRQGTGIGLHLVTQYVQLHGGKITLDSKKGQGSTFSVYLPTDLKLKEEPKTLSETAEAERQPQDGEKKIILVVEDNDEFRRFLAEQLSSQFNVLQASDGVEGEETVQKNIPDIIISDLMMPRMTGVELCSRLKNDIRFSHIPVILLTAKLSDEAKIESYKAGADSYIAKPFNFEVLQTRIEMLIEQQEKRKRIFRKNIDVQPSEITTTSLDEEFIKKALELIEKNIGNAEYSNDDLSRDLGMSRSSLYPKFQSITGQTPNHFIRSIRLKRAAQLLQGTQSNISEISWMVGISDVKYFNKYFKEDFGQTPSQYRAEHKGK